MSHSTNPLLSPPTAARWLIGCLMLGALTLPAVGQLSRAQLAQMGRHHVSRSLDQAVKPQVKRVFNQAAKTGDFDAAAKQADALFKQVLAYAGVDDAAAFRDAAFCRRLMHQLAEADLDDGPDLLTYLRKNQKLARQLAFLLTKKDRPKLAYGLLQTLRQEHGDELNKYAALTAALCVVRDKKKPLTRRINENHATAAKAPALFDYYLKHQDKMLFGIDHVPAELLVFVVDSSASIKEMNWALRRYAGDKKVGARFFDIDYDYKSYHTGAKKALTRHGFSLPHILQYGGVCADQAYFAVAVGKSIGVPSCYTVGRSGQMGHAWVGFLQARRGRPVWNFNIGRYKAYQGVIGVVRDPQTDQRIPSSFVSLLAELSTVDVKDRYTAVAMTDAARLMGRMRTADKSLAKLKRPVKPSSKKSSNSRKPTKDTEAGPSKHGKTSADQAGADHTALSQAASDQQADSNLKASADTRTSTKANANANANANAEAKAKAKAKANGGSKDKPNPPGLKVPRKLTPAAQLNLVEAGLRPCPGYAPGWLSVRQLAKAGQLSMKQKTYWSKVLTKLCGSKYPDFTLAILKPMISTVKDIDEQDQLWDRLFKQFRRRHDLAARVRMAQGRMWQQAGNMRKAGQCYEDVVKRFANAGPFVIGALERTEQMLEKVHKGDRVVELYKQTWSHLRKPGDAAPAFRKQSNWYHVGQMYLKRLHQANEPEQAARVKEKLAQGIHG